MPLMQALQPPANGQASCLDGFGCSMLLILVIYALKWVVSQNTCHDPYRFQRISSLA